MTFVGKKVTYLCVKQAMPLIKVGRNLSMSSTSFNLGKIYELRTYSMKPAHFRSYLELTKEKLHLRVAHSKLYGFWFTELGGAINEANHIWEYDNFAHRTEVRQNLAMDQDWMDSYISHMAPFLVKQENAVLLPVAKRQIEESPIQEGGVYELCRYEAKPGHESPLLQAVMDRAELVRESGNGKLMGLFSTDVGHNNSVYHLWNYRSMDKRQDVNALLSDKAKDKTKDLHNHVFNMFNKLMIPLPTISPLK